MSDLDADFLSLPNNFNESDSDSDDSNSSSSSSSSSNSFDPSHLPPWLLNTLPNGDEHPLLRLHNEIVQFSKVSLGSRDKHPLSWVSLHGGRGSQGGSGFTWG